MDALDAGDPRRQNPQRVHLRRGRILHPRRAQRMKGFTVQSIPEVESGVDDNSTIDALADHSVTPPGERASLGGYDLRAWIESLGPRDGAIAQGMAAGETTTDLAGRFGLSQARGSQM